MISNQWSVLLSSVPSAWCGVSTLSLSFPLSLFYLFLFSLSLSLVILRLAPCLHTHIKWRAAVRFQFRTNLWCCRPPTRSAVAEGTQGSPITALYANVPAPGQQRGHAGTRSLFMQISGRQPQHNTEPATDTGGHISPPAQQLVGKTWKSWKMWTEWQKKERGVTAYEEIGEYVELMVNKCMDVSDGCTVHAGIWLFSLHF